MALASYTLGALKSLKDIPKAERLQLSRNRPDERLLNNRIWLPITRNSWAGRLKSEIVFENVKMNSDERTTFKQDTHHRFASDTR
jgi:hypothetical protein